MTKSNENLIGETTDASELAEIKPGKEIMQNILSKATLPYRVSIEEIINNNLSSPEIIDKIFKTYPKQREQIISTIEVYNVQVDERSFEGFSKCFGLVLKKNVNNPDVYIRGSLLNNEKTEQEINDILDLLENNETVKSYFNSIYGEYKGIVKQDQIEGDKRMVFMNYVRGVFSKNDIMNIVHNKIPFDFLLYYPFIGKSIEPFSVDDFNFLLGLQAMHIDGYSQYACFFYFKRGNLTLSQCKEIKEKYPDKKDFKNYMENEYGQTE